SSSLSDSEMSRIGSYQRSGKINNSIHDRVPVEILEQILINLDVESIRSYCRVDKLASKICETRSFWIAKMDHDFTQGFMIPSMYFELFKPEYQNMEYETFRDNVVNTFLELYELIMTTKNIDAIQWL